MDEPRCTFFDQRCIYRKNRDCTILNSMPKRRKSGSCPFTKKHPEDIAGNSPTKTEKGEE